MMRYDEMVEKVRDFLEDLDTDELVSMHNEYCEDMHYSDYIYNMYDLDGQLATYTPSQILDMAECGEFNSSDDYFYIDDNEHLYSFDFAGDDNAPIYIKDLANYIVDNDDELSNDDVRELLDEMMADDEEDDDWDE